MMSFLAARSFFLLSLAALGLCATPARAQWSVDLGEPDQSHGLSIPNQGDGATVVSELGGRACRVVDRAKGASFIYADVAPDVQIQTPLFVTVDYFDRTGQIVLEFDAGAEAMLPYRHAPEVAVQTGRSTWRQATFTLRHAVFGGHQNFDGDFRLSSTGDPLALARITLSAQPPEGYTPPLDPEAWFKDRAPVTLPPGMEVVQQWQIHEPLISGQLDDAAYEACKKIGVTSLQSYVGWAQLEQDYQKLNFGLYDPLVNQLRHHGLKWLPMIIAGPRMATPVWFQDASGVPLQCLEHNQTIAIQSIWNPALRAGVRRYLEIFRSHYEPEIIEGLDLGISGNWGEAIMPAGGGFGMSAAHSHMGWWCGDDHARADLRRWVSAKYETLEKLNAAWHTQYTSLDDVQPFLPQDAPSRRALADFTRWYQESMTDYAEFWIKASRELYPDTPIYLCLGGYGEPCLGADFGALARMGARYNAGIRITNLEDDAARNFAVTRMVASSTRLYGQYYSTEPGGDNSALGMAGRIFDAVSGGARSTYYKELVSLPNLPAPNGVLFAQNARYYVPNAPKLTVAALMSNTSLALDAANLGLLLDRTARLRDALDFEFIDENMIADGLHEKFGAIVVLAGDSLEEATLAKLEKWTAQGGVLLAPEGLLPFKNVEEQEADWSNPAAKATATIQTLGGWATPVGQGWLWVCPAADNESLCALMSAALHAQPSDAPWPAQLTEPLDAVFDNVLASRVDESIYYYNNGDAPVSKLMPGAGEAVTIAPRKIYCYPEDSPAQQ